MVGFDEIIFIAIIALLLFGPDKLPEYIREMGRLYAEFKKAQRDLEGEFNKVASSAIETPPQTSGTILEIARKMEIPIEGKTDEQLLTEIDAAVAGKTGKI
jgi:sec-independent protein translocase protein TatA